MKKTVSVILCILLTCAMFCIPVSAQTYDLSEYQIIVDEINHAYGVNIELREGVKPDQTPAEFREETLALVYQQIELKKEIKSKSGDDSNIFSFAAANNNYDVSRTKTVNVLYYVKCTYTCVPGTPNRVTNVRYVEGGVYQPLLVGVDYVQTGCDVAYIDSHRIADIIVYGDRIQGIQIYHDYALHAEFGFVAR